MGEIIKSSKQSTKESFERIKKGQSGDYTPIKTRYDHLNEITHGGLGRQRIITIGGLSSFGKSHTLRQIEEDIFNEELNPNSKENVLLLKVDWEMTKEEAILYRVHEKTGISFEDLMYGKPNDVTKKAFNDVYKEFNTNYIYDIFLTLNADVFYNEVKSFCEKHQDKKQIILTIDNSNLIDSENKGETEALSALQTNLIRLKREIYNLTIIQLAQLNRELKKRTELKDMFPKTSDFFNSSKIEHASDVQIIIHNPYLMGYMEYGAVNIKRYEHLSEYLVPKNKYHTFRTEGLVFWHYVKVRMKNDMRNFKDVFIEKIFEVDEEPPKQVRQPLFEEDEPPF